MRYLAVSPTYLKRVFSALKVPEIQVNRNLQANIVNAPVQFATEVENYAPSLLRSWLMVYPLFNSSSTKCLGRNRSCSATGKE